MPIRVKLDDLLHDRRMTLTELAEQVDLTLANLSILKTGKARAIRFSTLQARYSAFVDLWDRGMRAKEEGRPGPFSHLKAEKAGTEKPPPDRVVFVAAFRDPMAEMDKLHDLYDSLADARRQLGDDSVPFHKFAELVKTQVERLQASGNAEVAFRVAMKDGKVNLTARALHGPVDDEE